ncbi:MAG: hypothetical protein CBD47_03875 [Synechococcus sp. TMED187]|jgi:hypothetical protein|nr:MAG: hypothetical protein CBD47_03875 [Synechococcus sp. TMED187]
MLYSKTTTTLLLAAYAAAQPFCPTGQGLYRTTVMVKDGKDDVEEAHGNPPDCMDGFLYQGSSDLEVGQDIEV